MEWRYLKTGFDEGLALSAALQNAWMAAYLAHVSAGRGYLFEAAIFTRSSYIGERSYEFYFTPQTVDLLAPMLKRLGATPCEAPPRRREGEHRHEGIGLCVGEARAWDLLPGKEGD